MEQWFRDNMKWELEFYDMVEIRSRTQMIVLEQPANARLPVKHFGFTWYD